MPFHPGVLFSALLMILCLGINIASYPEVAQISGSGGKQTGGESTPQENEELTALNVKPVEQPVPVQVQAEDTPELKPAEPDFSVFSPQMPPEMRTDYGMVPANDPNRLVFLTF
ncbi:MAG: hypothetical protein LBN39_11500 [Planctomycetaceae bacterium]|nr:hypothetical protein [Planctomycetaceae bacterium]